MNKGTNLKQRLAYDCNPNSRPILEFGAATKLKAIFQLDKLLALYQGRHLLV